MRLTPAIFTEEPKVPEGFIEIGTPVKETHKVFPGGPGLPVEDGKWISQQMEGYIHVRVRMVIPMRDGTGSHAEDMKTAIWVTKDQYAHMTGDRGGSEIRKEAE